MMWIAIAALVAGQEPNTLAGAPAFSGGDFERLVEAVQSECRRVEVVHLTPAGLLGIDEQFREGLTPARRHRLDVALPRGAGDGLAVCANHGGASCDAIAYLHGFRKSGLWSSFVQYVCQPGTVR